MAKVVKSSREIFDVDSEIKKLEEKSAKKNKKQENKKNVIKKKNVSKDKKYKKPKSGFFHEVRKEISKVKWPSKKEMVKYSIATIVFIIFFAIFFYLIELILALLKMGV